MAYLLFQLKIQLNKNFFIYIAYIFICYLMFFNANTLFIKPVITCQSSLFNSRPCQKNKPCLHFDCPDKPQNAGDYPLNFPCCPQNRLPRPAVPAGLE